MSIITRVSVHEFAYELQHLRSLMAAEAGARLTLGKFACVIETDDGLRGEYVPQYGGNAMSHAQVCEMAPMLIGRDAEARVKIWEDLHNAFRHYDRVGMAAIDAALWDLAGKKYAVPVARLLGGYRNRLPAYASTYPGQTTPGGLDSIGAFADFAERCAEMGYPAFKIHGFWDGSARSEIAVMAAVRDRVGERMRLMTDPASTLAGYLEAVEVGRACDDMGFLWYEDPFRDASSSAFAHKRLGEAVNTPLVIGEHIRGVEQKANFLIQGGTDILHIDPELDGGITGTMKLAQFAEGIGMDVQLHTAGPIHRACMAAIPNTYYYEMGLVGPGMVNSLVPPVYACGYDDQLDSVDAEGCVPVPDGPGLGVTYDWARIEAWQTGVRVFA